MIKFETFIDYILGTLMTIMPIQQNLNQFFVHIVNFQALLYPKNI